jgi:hypothetical protein
VDVQAFLDFGRGLELPEGTIQDLVVRAPAGLAGEAPSGSAALGPAYLTDFHPQVNCFQVVDPTGTVIAETIVHMTAPTRGPRGGVEVAGVDAGRAFDVRIQLLPTPGCGAPQGSTQHLGAGLRWCALRRLLPGLQVREALCAPHELLWRAEFGPVILGRIPMPPEPVIQLPTGFLRLVEAMSLIQEHTSIPIVMPEEVASEEVRDILVTARLLRDGS